MKSNFLIIFLLLLLQSSIGFGQQSEIDAFKVELRKFEQACDIPCPADTDVVRYNIRIARRFHGVSQDSAMYYYDQAVRVATELGNHKFMAMAYQYYGKFYKVFGEIDEAVKYYNKAISVTKDALQEDGANEIEIELEIANLKSLIGSVYAYYGDYEKAIGYFEECLVVREKYASEDIIAAVLVNLGNVLNKQGEYDKAIECFQRSLKIYEELGNKKNEEACLANMGLVHYNQGNLDLAENYYNKALDICVELQDNIRICNNCITLGNIYFTQDDFEKAMSNFQRSLIISQDQEYLDGIGRSYQNIGVVYSEQGNYKEAMEYYEKAAEVFDKTGHLGVKAYLFLNIAQLSSWLSDSTKSLSEKKMYYKRAVNNAEHALEIAIKTGAIPVENKAYKSLNESWAGLGNYKKAWEYSQRQIETGDSLYNADKLTAVRDMETKYQTEKKQLQIENLEKDQALKDVKIEAQASDMKRQLILIYSFVIVFVIILVFTILLVRMFLQKKRANVKLEIQNHQIMQQNEEIEAQRDEIENQRDMVIKQMEHIKEINQEIKDSIHYARRIQGAILPREEYAKELLSDYFVLFKPKDIVSGDFYWMTNVEGRIVITAADCTGHGVPGAFMSMLGAAFLNEIVNKEYMTHTGVILRKLRKEVIKALQQKGQSMEQKDGMDMAIISIDPKLNELQFSGANNPLFIVRPKETEQFDREPDLDGENYNLYEIKGDKMPIAIYEKMDKFAAHDFKIEKGDCLYMFSDGYPDQFGGPKGKKFKYKPFKRLLLENAHRPMAEQQQILEEALDNWINYEGTEYEQVDDITVVGIRV